MSTHRLLIVAAGLGLAAGQAAAYPVQGIYVDDPTCDNHGALEAVDELGTIVFPPDELIDSISTLTDLSACPAEDDPLIPNSLVRITNLTQRTFTDLFYVGDASTSLSNVDGRGVSSASPAFAGHAFRIDAIGMNKNLISESGVVDGIFAPGETWSFIVQDYAHPTGLPASAMASLDFAGASDLLPGTTDSTGSIVQFIVPTPSTTALVAASAVVVGIRRRRKDR